MKVAVFLLILLVLIVAGLVAAIFWEQPDTISSYAPSLPFETPEPPPGPIYEGGHGADITPAETPSHSQGGAEGTGSDQSAAPTETPIHSQTDDPGETPAESPSPSTGPLTQETPEELNDRRSIMLMQAEELYIAGSYREALTLLRRDETLFNDDTARLESEILAAMR